MLICAIRGRKKPQTVLLFDISCAGHGGTPYAPLFIVMFTILCIVAVVWMVCSGLFVAALAAASKRTLPMPHHDIAVLEKAA